MWNCEAFGVTVQALLQIWKAGLMKAFCTINPQPKSCHAGKCFRRVHRLSQWSLPASLKG